MPQVEDAKFIFLKKSYHTEKITVVKIILLVAIIQFHRVFLLSQIFSEMFFA